MNLTPLDQNFQYVTFRLESSLIGVNILEIREIIPCTRITRVQQAPEFVFGLMNMRGQILTVLDIGILLGQEKRKIHPDSHIFIFKHKDIGVIVDQIGDVVSIDPDCIESAPANIDPMIQKYMEHIINLPDEILMVLNAKKILSHTRPMDEMPKESL